MTDSIAVLVVDDDDQVREISARRLSGAGYVPVCAASGEEALALLSQQTFGLALLDILMTGISGIEVLREIRSRYPDLAVIMVTSEDSPRVARSALELGALGYLVKPFNENELLIYVSHMLRLHQLEKEHGEYQEKLEKWNTDLEVRVQEQTMELSREYDKVKALNTKLRANFKSTIAAFAGLLELRDKRARSHSRNVADLASRAAIQLKMSREEVEMIVIAALLHDIGKVGMSDFLLSQRPEEMNSQEYDEYAMHPIRGQATVDIITDLRPVGEIIRHHHEHFDGTGFPDKLKGKQIPLAAMLVSIADFIDRQVRNFPEASAVEMTMKKVTEESHKRFDPKLTVLFIAPAKELYKKKQPRAGYVERELFPKDLEEGMLLGRDVYSGTGILLLSKGVTLNSAYIQLLRRYYELDPDTHGILVWV
jgi:response regulator RpfG family c-di-GMP phosphodiesterase